MSKIEFNSVLNDAMFFEIRAGQWGYNWTDSNYTTAPSIEDTTTRIVSGAARKLHTFICVAVRSGIGAGVVINGKLHRGSNGFAGQVAYSTVPSGHAAGQWQHLYNVVSEHALNVDAESDDFHLTPGAAERAGRELGAQLASAAAWIDPRATPQCRST